MIIGIIILNGKQLGFLPHFIDLCPPPPKIKTNQQKKKQTKEKKLTVHLYSPHQPNLNLNF